MTDENRRCPECMTHNVHARKTKTPEYRCENGHEFETPVDLTRDVHGYVRDNPGATLRGIRAGIGLPISPEMELSSLIENEQIRRVDGVAAPNRHYPLERSRPASSEGNDG